MARPSSFIVIAVAAMSVAAMGLAWPVIAQGQGQGAGQGGGQGQGQGQGGTAASAGSESAAESGNDAGSGADAGDSPVSPTAIANAQRTWSANLTPAGTDADWYSLDASGAFCAEGSVTPQSPGSITVADDATRATATSRSAPAHTPTRLALASTAGHVPLLGVESPSLSAMQASEGGNGGGPPTPSRYTFAFSARTHGQLDPEGDGESPEAGATPATAAALPLDCSAGRLGSGDVVDLYQFTVEDVRDMTFSFAIASGEGAQMRIVDPSGVTVATLQSGDARDVWADQPGAWTVVVEGLGSAPPAALALPGFAARSATSTSFVGETLYLVGVTDGPDPEPCRPSC